MDDASYPAGKDPPTLRLTHDGNLRLDYNELGFRKIDVQAICRIGGSTKTNSASTTGEKGIGFKSIFRVADAVWIASHRTEPRPRTYTFKFEKSGSLGQIRPIWVSGAMSGDMRPPQDGGTSMYLEVPEAKRDKVRSALDGFDPTTLLFLRKLTRIEIQRGERPLRMLHRTMEEAPDGCRHDVVFEAIAGVSTPVRCYKTLRFDVDGLPRRLKQGDRTRSEMLLSFPVTPNFDSATSSESQCHKVYTYLPVKDYGFKVRPDYSSLPNYAKCLFPVHPASRLHTLYQPRRHS